MDNSTAFFYPLLVDAKDCLATFFVRVLKMTAKLNISGAYKIHYRPLSVTTKCILRKALCIFFCLAAVASPVKVVHADSISINLDIISRIESSNRASVVGDSGRAYGLYQLHAAAVSDVNRFLKAKFTHKDALDPAKARVIADTYLNKVIPSYLKYYKLKDTLENRLTAYNAGILSVKRGRLATNYIKKYKSLRGRSEVSPSDITANRLKTA